MTPILWGEFLVNTVTEGVQSGAQLQALDNGKFLATWQSTTVNELGVTDSAIYAQRFYSGAVPQGDPIRIGTTFGGINSNPTVTVLSDGRLVYTWERYEKVNDQDHYSIRARVFNADGTPFDTNGAEPDGTGDFELFASDVPVSKPVIQALTSGGGFVVAYNNSSANAPADAGVEVAVYGADLNRYEGDITVNNITEGIQNVSSVVSLTGGRFIVFYNDEGTTSEGPIALCARVFSTDNGIVSGSTGTDLTITTSNKRDTNPVATVLSDGRILVVWTESATDGTGDNVKAQVFNWNMSPNGDAFVVNQGANGDQDMPGVTALAQGGFAITYLDSDGLNAPLVRVAIFDENNNRVGSDTLLTYTPFDSGKRSAPKVIELFDGRLIAAWDEDVAGRSDDATGIHGQVIDARFKGINLPGSAENDQYVGTEYNDTLGGGSDGDDHLNGRQGNDILDGGIGRDTLNGGEGADRMTGGTGDDFYEVDNASDVVVEYAGGGNDTVNTFISYSIAGTEIENLTAVGTGAISLTGNASNNVITGNNADNAIDGAGGADTMAGGLGNDTYTVDNPGDVINEVAGAGIDSVFTTASYILSDNVENLTARGAAAIALTGNALNNVIVGNGGANKIAGGAGNDTLTGGAGKDAFIFNTAPDKFANRDTITDFNVKDDTIQLENAIFTKLTKTGKLNKKYFKMGTKAGDKDDYVIYNKKTGVLSYDADGKGKGQAVDIAVLKKNLALTYDKFFVI